MGSVNDFGPPRPQFHWILLIPLMVLLASCDDTSAPDDVYAGRIRGFVVTPEGPASGYEVLASRSNVDDPNRWARTRTRKDGYFEIPLVAGKYILIVRGEDRDDTYYTSGVLRPVRGQAEIIEVTFTDEVPLIEAAFGTLQLELRAPTLEGQEVRVDLQSPIFRDFIKESSTIIENGTGQLTFRDLPAGNVRVIVNTDDGSRVEAIPLIQDNPVDALTIQAGSVSSYAATMPPPSHFALDINTYLLEGQDEARVLLLLERADDGFRFGTLEATQNGRFEFETLGQAPFRILALHRSDDRFSVPRYLTSYFANREPAITFEPGSTTELPALESCSLELQFDTGRREGLEVAAVYFWNETGTEAFLASRVSSGEQVFSASYSGFLPEKIRIQLQTFENRELFHLDQWYSTDGKMGEPAVVDLGPAGTQTVLKWNPIQGARMKGIVVNADGIPQSDVVLSLTTAESDNFEGNLGRVDQFGQFDAGAFRDGSYKLGAVRHPAITRWYPGVEDWEDAEVLTISDLKDIEGLEFVFQ